MLPDWAKSASGKPAVSTHMLAGACKQVADAYTSNFEKQKKDPTHHFDIKFRSTRRTPSEVVRVDKDNGKKTSPFLRFEAAPH